MILNSEELAAERRAWLERKSKKVAEATARRRGREEFDVILTGEQLRRIRETDFLPPEDLSRKKR